MRLRTVVFSIYLFLLTTQSSSQVVTGTILGNVTDVSNALIANAAIT